MTNTDQEVQETVEYGSILCGWASDIYLARYCVCCLRLRKYVVAKIMASIFGVAGGTATRATIAIPSIYSIIHDHQTRGTPYIIHHTSYANTR